MDAAWQYSAVHESLWERLKAEMRLSKRYTNRLIMEYFVVEGHREAAAAFARESGVKLGEPLEAMDGRVTARQLLVEGRVDEAYKVLEGVSSTLLESRPDVQFRLAQQEFIELVRSRRIDEALELAERRLAPLADEHPEHREGLEDAMALLAFSTPESAPKEVASLLSRSYRIETAGIVNAAALTAQGQVQESRLPGLLRTLMHSQKRLEDGVEFPSISREDLQAVCSAYGRELLRSIGD